MMLGGILDGELLFSSTEEFLEVGGVWSCLVSFFDIWSDLTRPAPSAFIKTWG